MPSWLGVLIGPFLKFLTFFFTVKTAEGKGKAEARADQLETANETLKEFQRIDAAPDPARDAVYDELFGAEQPPADRASMPAVSNASARRRRRS